MRLHKRGHTVVGLQIPVKRRHLGLKGTKRKKKKVDSLDFQMQTTLLVKSGKLHH